MIRPVVRTLTTVVAAFSLALVVGCAGDPQEAEEQVFDTVPEPLIVEGGNAEIDLVATDGDRVRVSREASGQAGGEWGMEGDTLTLGSDCAVFSNCDVRYEVAIPATTPLSVSTDNGPVSLTGFTSSVEVTSANGTVRVFDATGPLDLSSDNGNMELDGVGSETARLATDNGTIDAAFTDRPSEVEVSTNNGNATLLLPDGPYAVFETVGNGEIETEVDTVDRSENTITARTDNGTIRLLPQD